MTIAVGDADGFDAHEVDATHPERPARSAVVRDGVARLSAIESRPAGWNVARSPPSL